MVVDECGFTAKMNDAHDGMAVAPFYAGKLGVLARAPRNSSRELPRRNHLIVMRLMRNNERDSTVSLHERPSLFIAGGNIGYFWVASSM